MVQCCFTSTETIRLIRTGSPGRPPQLFSHSSYTLKSIWEGGGRWSWCFSNRPLTLRCQECWMMFLLLGLQRTPCEYRSALTAPSTGPSSEVSLCVEDPGVNTACRHLSPIFRNLSGILNGRQPSMRTARPLSLFANSTP